jgi:hypothetical protein
MNESFAGPPPQQFHGLETLKECVKVTIGDQNNCSSLITNADTFLDEITIHEVCDNTEGVTTCFTTDPGFAIESLIGTASCASANTAMPCQLPALGDAIVVGIASHTMNNEGVINDSVTATYNDNCDTGDLNCSTDQLFQQAGAATFVENPSILVVKDSHAKTTVGASLAVSATVTNTGNIELTNVQAIDNKAGALVCGLTTLSTGESTTCIGSFTVTGSGTNTVVASGATQLANVQDDDTKPFITENPSIDVDKVCSVTGEDEITWTVTWVNTGNVALTNVSIDDIRTGNLFSGTLASGETGSDVFAESPLAAGTYTNTATATGDSQLATVTDSNSATCSIEERGGEGLTPGFWKANAENWEAGAWVSENPEDDFNARFGTSVELKLAKGNSDTDKGSSDSPTLYGALGARGGGDNALARHCVAAKLNVENPDVSYPLVLDEVINQCRVALNGDDNDAKNALKDTLDALNNLGADISQHWPN